MASVVVNYLSCELSVLAISNVTTFFCLAGKQERVRHHFIGQNWAVHRPFISPQQRDV